MRGSDIDNGILRIGRVTEVTGLMTTGELEAGSSDLVRSHDGRKYSVGQVGSIVRIDTGDRLLFGVLTQVSQLTAGQSGTVEIELFGQGIKHGLRATDFAFERGISAYPLPGQSIHVATVEELSQVYSRPDKATIKIGSLSQAQEIPVHLILDDLVGKHFAVLGTTGSGKSCTVTLLLQNMIEAYPHSHVVLLDPHNEYPKAFGDMAELVDPTTMDIPHWLLNFEETIELFVGRSDGPAPLSESNVVKDALLHARRAVTQRQTDKATITVDTPMPYKLGDLIRHIELAKSRVVGDEQDPFDHVLNKIETLKNDTRFRFLLKEDHAVHDTLVDMLSQYLRIP